MFQRPSDLAISRAEVAFEGVQSVADALQFLLQVVDFTAKLSVLLPQFFARPFELRDTAAPLGTIRLQA